MNARAKPQPHEVVAAIQADVLCPIEWFYSSMGGYTAFRRFRDQEGLRVHTWQRRPCVRPSELRAWQNSKLEDKTDE